MNNIINTKIIIENKKNLIENIKYIIMEQNEPFNFTEIMIKLKKFLNEKYQIDLLYNSEEYYFIEKNIKKTLLNLQLDKIISYDGENFILITSINNLSYCFPQKSKLETLDY